MRAAIAECRRRTVAHIPLPRRRGVHARIRHRQAAGRGYNWYQGNYRSLIQVNTDLPVADGPRRRSRLPRRLSRPPRLQHAARAEAGAGARLGRVHASTRSIRRRASSPRARPITASSSPFPGDERLDFETPRPLPARRPARPRAPTPISPLQEAMRELAGARFTIAARPARRPDQPRAGGRADPALPAVVARRGPSSRSPSSTSIAPM